MRPIPRPSTQKRDRSSAFLWAALIIIIVIIYAAYALFRPLPAPKTTIEPPVLPALVKVNIPWPTQGEAAFGADGYGVLATHSDQTPRPTASTAKVITALAILKKKPLQPGDQGPSITITQRDVDIYNSYVAKDGSTVPVRVGETVTEYQALQAMMLPSANNMADTTAIWAFGSLPDYITFANQFVKSMGMQSTTIANDASGFSPGTTSTASDLVKLGDAALDNPVLSDIVSQSQAVFPEYGTMDNVNTLLGRAGIRGIKTGNTDQAGGCYLAAADITVAGKKLTVITAVMGPPTLGDAMRSSLPIIQSAVSQFQQVQVVHAGQTVGQITTPWNGDSTIVADSGISVVAWTGTTLVPGVTASPVTNPVTAGKPAGSLNLSYDRKTYTSDLHIARSIPGPTAWWRLSHPL